MLEAGMNAEHAAAIAPLCRGPHLLRAHRHDEALVAAPRRADAEQFEAVDKSAECALVLGGQYHSEQTACAREIALPERVTRIARQRRMQHTGDLRLARQPFR